MAKIKPKITPNFRTEWDGLFPHFLILMGLQGNLEKVNNFGVHPYVAFFHDFSPPAPNHTQE